MRIGHGMDAHRLADGVPLVIGGVQIPFEPGLAAHSDGDVLIHALCDALLGAAALGTLAATFPIRILATRMRTVGHCCVAWCPSWPSKACTWAMST